MDRLADLDRLREHRWFGPLADGHRDFWMLIAACAISWAVPPAAVVREVRMLAIRATGGDWGEREVETRLGSVMERAHRAARGETVTDRACERNGVLS